MSENKEEMNLEHEMSKYLGGDDDILEGFLESDEEPQFDTLINNEETE